MWMSATVPANRRTGYVFTGKNWHASLCVYGFHSESPGEWKLICPAIGLSFPQEIGLSGDTPAEIAISVCNKVISKRLASMLEEIQNA